MSKGSRCGLVYSTRWFKTVLGVGFPAGAAWMSRTTFEQVATRQIADVAVQD